MSGDCPRATPVPTGAISKRSKALTTRPDARPDRNIRQAYARARFEKDGEVETFHPVARARREGSRPVNRSALDRDVDRKCPKRPFAIHVARLLVPRDRPVGRGPCHRGVSRSQCVRPVDALELVPAFGVGARQRAERKQPRHEAQIWVRFARGDERRHRWSSCVKCRVWRRRVGLTVLVGSTVRLRSAGDGILGAFFLLRARRLNPIAPKLLYGCSPFQRAHRAPQKLTSAQPVWSRRYAPPSLCCGPSVTPADRAGSEAIAAVRSPSDLVQNAPERSSSGTARPRRALRRDRRVRLACSRGCVTRRAGFALPGYTAAVGRVAACLRRWGPAVTGPAGPAAAARPHPFPRSWSRVS